MFKVVPKKQQRTDHTSPSYLIELKKSLKIDENSLGSFRSEESSHQSGGSDVSFKHQVELDGFRLLTKITGSLNHTIQDVTVITDQLTYKN